MIELQITSYPSKFTLKANKMELVFVFLRASKVTTYPGSTERGSTEHFFILIFLAITVINALQSQHLEDVVVQV